MIVIAWGNTTNKSLSCEAATSAVTEAGRYWLTVVPVGPIGLLFAGIGIKSYSLA